MINAENHIENAAVAIGTIAGAILNFRSKENTSARFSSFDVIDAVNEAATCFNPSEWKFPGARREAMEIACEALYTVWRDKGIRR